MEHERPFVFARAAVRYKDTAKDLIRILKFERNLEAVHWLGIWLCEAWTRYFAEIPFDYIVPVPLHPDRLRHRGFNQAYVLAKQLSEYSGIPILEPLQRISTRSSQASRTRIERLRSFEGAFQCSETFHNKVSNANILLVDDVFTTGATVEACTKELLHKGCTGVWVLTVAR
ncbi:ComF family protein [Fodinisporobacter ferrooxydans]|uniref:ComF family protein n=1 Tax=Fodinisporobacter ferrooxydans TaxID=2901836 RepID=A0ABY4CLN7_9BACL|nr:ComF family protein [Alicyclobacillaceae bacterium MYW30-H2]